MAKAGAGLVLNRALRIKKFLLENLPHSYPVATIADETDIPLKTMYTYIRERQVDVLPGLVQEGNTYGYAPTDEEIRMAIRVINAALYHRYILDVSKLLDELGEVFSPLPNFLRK
jgi:hypothetical protein